MKIPQILIYERNKDCKLCGEEMNPNEFNMYRGLEICSRCNEELKKKSGANQTMAFRFLGRIEKGF